jgi:hypothetical protein
VCLRVEQRTSSSNPCISSANSNGTSFYARRPCLPVSHHPSSSRFELDPLTLTIMEFPEIILGLCVMAATTLLVHYTFRTATCTNLGAFLLGLTVVPFIIYIYHHLTRDGHNRNDDSDSSVYDLKHGRLHINTDTPMWMNMGFWRVRIVIQCTPLSPLTTLRMKTVKHKRR